MEKVVFFGIDQKQVDDEPNHRKPKGGTFYFPLIIF
jgi:hypothetical protein